MATDTANNRLGTYGSLETDDGDKDAGDSIDNFNGGDDDRRALLEWRQKRRPEPDGSRRRKTPKKTTKGKQQPPAADGAADGRRRPRGSGMTRQDARRNVRVQRDKAEPPSAVFATLFGGDDDDSGRTASTSTSGATPEGSGERHHSLLYTILNPRSKRHESQVFQKFISAVVIFDLIMFVLSTDPAFGNNRAFFEGCEGVTSTIFLVEYVARLATVTESKRYGPYGPVMGRVRYALTWPAIIDAMATFPFWIELITGVEMPTLTYLRVFRLFRICKMQSWSRAMDAVWRVVYFNREILYVALLVCVFLVVVTAVLMYYLRPPEGTDLEDDFSSIPATMYMSTLMLTGQGGPDGTNLPWYTKAVVLLTGVFSVAMFAIPASMLTWGFEAEAERLAARARKRSLREQKRASRAAAGGGGDDGDSSCDSTSSSSSYSSAYSSADDTSDEEYFKIISGEAEEGEDGEAGDGTGGDGGPAGAAGRTSSSALSSNDDNGGNDEDEGDGARYVKLTELRHLLVEAAAVARGNGVVIGRPPGDTPPSRSVGTVGGDGGGGGDTSSPPPQPPPSSVLLSSRMDRLEAKVESADAKLDRLLRMVESMQQQQR